MRELSGRVGVVTGAASGIGRGIAECLANEGMKLVVADVDEPALDAFVAELTAAGTEAIGVVTDVSSRKSVENLAAATMDRFGAVHVLCNNAGVETGGAFDSIPEQGWRWVIDVNLFGVVFGCQVFLPLLRAQDEAHIVNTASVAAFESSVPTMAPYTASKFAVLGATESLSYELRARGDRVGISVLAPGAVRTRMAEAERTRPANVPGTLDDPARKATMDAMRQLMETNGMEAHARRKVGCGGNPREPLLHLHGPADRLRCHRQAAGVDARWRHPRSLLRPRTLGADQFGPVEPHRGLGRPTWAGAGGLRR